MSDDKTKLNEEVADIQSLDRILLVNNNENIVPYTAADAVELKSGLSVEEKFEDLEKRFQGVLDSTDDKSSLHHHDTLYYRESEIDEMVSALENRIASINTSNHTHSQYALKADVYTKLDFDTKFGSSLSNIVVKSDLGDYTKKTDLENYLTKNEATNYASKEELDNKADKAHNHDDRYYNRAFIDKVIGDLNTEDTNIRSYIAAGLEEKANVEHAHSQYALEKDVYTKGEVNGFVTTIENEISSIDNRVTANTETIKSLTGEVGSLVTKDDLNELYNDLVAEIGKKSSIGHGHLTSEVIHIDSIGEDTLANVIDNIYYEIDDIVSDSDKRYAPKEHEHNSLYYTETEIDNQFTTFATNISSVYATKQSVIDGLSTKAELDHTHEELENEVKDIRDDLEQHLESKEDIHGQYALKEFTYTMDDVNKLIDDIEYNIDKSFVTYEFLGEALDEKADLDHTHNDITDSLSKLKEDFTNHNHDTEYYTRAEMDESIGTLKTRLDNTYKKEDVDSLLDTKAAEDHDHNLVYSQLGHVHDDIYYRTEDVYTKGEVDDLIPDISELATKEELSKKADLDHTHEDLDIAIKDHKHDDYYLKEDTMSSDQIISFVQSAVTEGVIDLSEYATKKEVETKADKDHKHEDLSDAITALETNLGSHNHDKDYYKREDVYNKTEMDIKLSTAAYDGTIDMSKYATTLEMNKKADKDHVHENLEVNVGLLNDFMNSHTHENFYAKDKVYTKSEVDDLLTNLDIDGEVVIDLSSYARKEDLETKLDTSEFEAYQTQTNELLINHTHDGRYYKTSETMTREEITEAISNAISSGTLNMSDYVTASQLKKDLDNKSDVGHEHDQYSLTDHEHDEYSKKDEVTSKEDFESFSENVSTSLQSITIQLGNVYLKNEVNDLISLKADAEHEHSQYSLADHTHNDFYTKKEVDELLVGIDGDIEINLEGYATKKDLDAKANTEHTHDEYSPVDHTHNYTTKENVTSEIAKVLEEVGIADFTSKSYVDKMLETKASKDHTHDIYASKEDFDTHNHDLEYFKRSETLSTEQIQKTIEERITDGNFANVNDVQALLDKKSDSGHTHKDLEERIATNKSEIESLQTLVGHDHDSIYYTEKEIDDKLKAINETLDSKVDGETFNTALNTKSDVTHSHVEFKNISDEINSINETLSTHNHDKDYYLRSEIYNKKEVDDKEEAIYEEITAITEELATKATIDELAKKAEKDHNHEGTYAEADHLHDEYYSRNDTFTKNETLAEITSAINQAKIEATENAPDLSIYALRSEVENSLKYKSDTNHKHDDDYAAASHTHDSFYLKIDTYNKKEVDKVKSDLEALIEETENKLPLYALKDDMKKELDNKAIKDHTHDEYAAVSHTHDDFYIKKEVYTKVETDNAISEEIESLNIKQYVTNSTFENTLKDYSKTSHEHDTVYAPLEHVHSQYAELSNVMLKKDLEVKFEEIEGSISNVDDKFANYTTTDNLKKLLDGKSNEDHRHDDDYAPLVHDHDNDYMKIKDGATKSELEESIAALDINSYAKTTWVTVQLTGKAAVDHKHDDDYAPLVHDHNNDYYLIKDTYNKKEVDTFISDTTEYIGQSVSNLESLIAKKADATHRHDNDYAALDHTHDIYYLKQDTYNKTEIDSKFKNVEEKFQEYALISDLTTGLAGKADKDHHHDNKYYTQDKLYTIDDVDGLIGGVNSKIDTLTADIAKNYLKINVFEETINDVNSTITALDSSLNSHKTEFTAFKKNIEENYTTKGELESTSSILTNNINTVKTSLENFQKLVAEEYVLKTDFESFSTSISSTVSTIKADLSKLTKDFNEFVEAADEKFVLNDETYKNFYKDTYANIASLSTTLKDHLEEYGEFVQTITQSVESNTTRIGKVEVDLSKLIKDFNELITETLPNTYLEITTFNTYKNTTDSRLTSLEDKLKDLIGDFEAHLENYTATINTINSNISSLDNKLKVFITETAPNTYLDINTFENFKNTINGTINSLSSKLDKHIETFEETYATLSENIEALKSNLETEVQNLNTKIKNNYDEFLDFAEDVGRIYVTKQDFSDYKIAVSNSFAAVNSAIADLTSYVDLTFATKTQVDTIEATLNKKIADINDLIEGHVTYAENTYATKSELTSALALKADISWVSSQLELKSDVGHRHDELYLPIVDAELEGRPTTTTPEAGSSDSRIPNTAWVSDELLAVKNYLDGIKLNKDENAVSASKLYTPSTISFYNGISGMFEFDGSENVNVDITLTGNAPTASKWETKRTLTIEGIADGSVEIDGSQDVNLTLAYNDSFSAPSAHKWTRPMKLTLAKDIEGEVLFDGSQDVTLETTIVGNAPTASKLFQPTTINGVSFDGSAPINITDDSKLPKTGGEMSGSIIMNNAVPLQFKDISGVNRDILNFNSTGKLILGYSGLPQNEAVVYSNNGLFAIRHAGFADYDINGNSASATKLQTPRNFSIVGAITSEIAPFDGTDNVVLNVTEINLESSVFKGILPIELGGTGNYWGEAPSATKLQTAVNINEALFDGQTSIGIGTLEPIKIPAQDLFSVGANDLNSYKKPGMYFCDSSATAGGLANSPTKNAFALLVEKHNGYHQRITEYMTGNHKIFERNFVGNAWGPWYEVFTTANEPSKIADQVKNSLTVSQFDAEENQTDSVIFNGSEAKTVTISPKTLKVLPLIGGNLSGNLVFDNDIANVKFKNSGGTEFSALNMSPSNILNVGDVNIKTNINSSANPTTTINGNTYTFYHTGNIPTPEEVGAVNKAGDTMTGSLVMNTNAFIKLPNTHSKVVLNNETALIPGASVLSNSDANIRIATPYTIGFTPTTSGGKVASGNNGVWIDAKNGDIYAHGNIYENVGDGGLTLKEQYMAIVKDSSNLYGMKVNGSTKEFVRTTEDGLLPNTAGSSSLGSATWNFGQAYIKNINEDNQPLSERYLALHENTIFENSKNIALSGSTLQLTLDRMQKCNSSFASGKSYTIKLPTVSGITGVNGEMDTFTIHILFTSMNGGTLTFANASNMKWYATPQIINGKIHEFIFTYYNGTWVGGVIHYG